MATDGDTVRILREAEVRSVTGLARAALAAGAGWAVPQACATVRARVWLGRIGSPGLGPRPDRRAQHRTGCPPGLTPPHDCAEGSWPTTRAKCSAQRVRASRRSSR